MSSFAENALRIFQAAEAAREPSEMTILIGSHAGMRLVCNSDWPLESLRLHHGADMAYRVTCSESQVRVEGRSRGQTCVFESTPPAVAARLLLRTCTKLRPEERRCRAAPHH